MTVSALVRVLVESFLPDTRQKYVMQNLKVSEWYHQYRSFVPDFLQGRPCSLIIHCLERQAKAKKFDEANIKSNPQDSIFTIIRSMGVTLLILELKALSLAVLAKTGKNGRYLVNTSSQFLIQNKSGNGMHCHHHIFRVPTCLVILTRRMLL